MTVALQWLPVAVALSCTVALGPRQSEALSPLSPHGWYVKSGTGAEHHEFFSFLLRRRSDGTVFQLTRVDAGSRPTPQDSFGQSMTRSWPYVQAFTRQQLETGNSTPLWRRTKLQCSNNSGWLLNAEETFRFAFSADQSTIIFAATWHMHGGGGKKAFMLTDLSTSNGAILHSVNAGCGFKETDPGNNSNLFVYWVDVSASNRVAVVGHFASLATGAGVAADLSGDLLVWDYDPSSGFTYRWKYQDGQRMIVARWTLNDQLVSVAEDSSVCAKCGITIKKFDRDGNVLLSHTVAQATVGSLTLSTRMAAALNNNSTALYVTGNVESPAVAASLDVASKFVEPFPSGLAPSAAFLLMIDLESTPPAVRWGAYLSEFSETHGVVADDTIGVYVYGSALSRLSQRQLYGGAKDAAIWRFHSSGHIAQTWQAGDLTDQAITDFHWDNTTGLYPVVSGGSGGSWLGPGEFDDVFLAEFRYNASDCPAGTYSTVFPSCSDCTAGRFTAALGEAQCSLCQAGRATNVNSSASSCEPCPAGQYSDAATGNSWCKPCGPGRWSSAGESACSLCSAGSYSGEGQANCDPCDFNTFQHLEGQLSCFPCPRQSTTAFTGSETVQDCQCSEGDYGRPTDTDSPSACRACPGGAKCPRGSKTPLPPPGFYIESADLDTMYTCSPRSSCPGDALDSCAPGYVGTGCVECDAGYTRKNLECAECTVVVPLWARVLIGVAFFAAVVVCLLLPLVLCGAYKAALHILCRPDCQKKWFAVTAVAKRVFSRVFKALSWLIRLSQLSGIILALDIPWSPELESFFSVTVRSVDILTVENWVELDCMLEGTAIPKGIVTGLAVVALVAVLVISPSIPIVAGLLSRLIAPGARRRQADDVVSFITRVIGRAWLLLYIPLHVAAVNAFRCYRVSDSSAEFRLVVEPGTLCYTTEGEWVYYAGVAAAVFVLVSVSFPVLVAVLMCLRGRTRVGSSPLFADRFGFLYESYNERYYYFAAVDLLQRMMIPFGFLLAMNGGIFDQLVHMMGVTLVFLLYYLTKRVYRDSADQMANLLVQVAVYTTALAAICFMIEGGLKASASMALSGMLIALYSAVFVFFIVLVLDAVIPGLLDSMLRLVDGVWPPPPARPAPHCNHTLTVDDEGIAKAKQDLPREDPDLHGREDDRKDFVLPEPSPFPPPAPDGTEGGEMSRMNPSVRRPTAGEGVKTRVGRGPGPPGRPSTGPPGRRSPGAPPVPGRTSRRPHPVRTIPAPPQASARRPRPGDAAPLPSQRQRKPPI